MVLAAYCFTTCYKNNISLKKKDSPTSNILYDMQKKQEGVSKLTLIIILLCHSERSEESTLCVSRRRDASLRSA